MTVDQLIAILSTFPADKKVMLSVLCDDGRIEIEPHSNGQPDEEFCYLYADARED